jgi:hypothetical protein
LLLAPSTAPVMTTEGPTVPAGTRLGHAPPGAPGRQAHALAARPAGPPHAAAPPAALGRPTLVPAERPTAARPPQDAALSGPVVPGRLDCATATLPAGTPTAAKMALREPAGTPPDQNKWRHAIPYAGHEWATDGPSAGLILRVLTGSTNSGRRCFSHCRRLLLALHAPAAAILWSAGEERQRRQCVQLARRSGGAWGINTCGVAVAILL